jgi:kynurenine formamidase/alkylhydroperoxidase/carboxymuconolactone decarboxylase family protein YurZ
MPPKWESGVRIVDLSVTLGGPGFVQPSFFPPVEFVPIHTHEEHKKANTKVSMPIHAGTHADSPWHSLPDGQTIDQMPLDLFIGPAVKIDLRKYIEPHARITPEQLIEAAPDVPLRGKIVALYSGWLNQKYGTHEYYDEYPTPTTEAVQWILDQGAKAIAMDTAIDAGAASTVEGGFVNHRLVASAGMPLIENVANLGEVPTEFTFIGFPAKYHGRDGAPVRAVALIDDVEGSPELSTALRASTLGAAVTGSESSAAAADSRTDSAPEGAENLPEGYDPKAFAFFRKYFTEENARSFFEFVRKHDMEFFRLWQAWVPAGMYSRTVLDQKTRELCAIAASVALNALPQVRAHVTGALYAGATKEEALEVILQQGVYSGLPYAIQALAKWDEAVEAFDAGGGYSGL